MDDTPPKTDRNPFGWLVTISRHKGDRPIRYYVAIGDQHQALNRVRHILRLKDTADVSFRYPITIEDAAALGLKLGDVVRA